MRKSLVIKSVLLCLVMLVVVSCGEREQYPYVSLKGSEISIDVDQMKDTNSIRIAISSVISLKESRDSYDDFVQYIGQKLNKSIILIQRQTYAEVTEMLKEGTVDMALICSLDYVTGREQKYLIGIASPEVSGKAFYRSYLIVRKNSEIQTLNDLRGKRFAFTDPNSFSGRLAVLYALKKTGFEEKSFFKTTFFTYSHDYSVKAVSKGIVDGATVDSLVLDQMIAMGKEEAGNIRIISTGEWVGTPPVVTSSKVSEELREQIVAIILEMNKDKQGKEILKGINIDRFVPIVEENYTPILRMYQFVGDS